MDWAQYFAEFMTKMPGGWVILGVIGGAVCLAPFIPKIINVHKSYMSAKIEARKADEERKQKEEEDRLQQIAEEREFRTTITKIMETLPEMTSRIESLSTTAGILKDTNDKLAETNDSLSKGIALLDAKVEKLDEKMTKLEKSSSGGDETLRKSINQIIASTSEMKVDIQSVTGKVTMIIESDLDDFRNYLIDTYNQHVYGNVPMTKRDIEILCMKFKKYKREGGNGWAEKLYFEILQCDTTDGVRAEEVAKQFHYFIETELIDHHEINRVNK